MTKRKAAPTPILDAPTLVTFLLDRTGSMTRIRDDTIGGYNTYIGGLKANPAGLTFNLVQFDSTSVDKVHVNKPIQEVPDLDRASFIPRDGTPLIDASYKTIKAVEGAVKARTDNPKIIICIMTDGDENASREHTWDQLSDLIREKREAGWEFNFMGAGIDAYKQGARMGIDTLHTMSYDAGDAHATRMAFASSAENTQGYRTGLRASTSYSAEQKLAAKDAFDPAGPTIGRTTRLDPRMSPVVNALDLAALAKFNARKQEAAKAKPQIVDDFAL